MPKLTASQKQLLLLLGAVAVPSAAVLLFGLRSARDETALARQAAVEHRRQSARRVAQQLELTLEQVRLSIADPVVERPARFAGLLLARPLHATGGPDGSGRTGRHAAQIREAQAAEYRGDAPRAIARYTALLRLDIDTGTSALARLGLARTLARAGRASEAVTRYAELLELPFTVRDDEGIPIALYAAERLVDLPDHRPAVADRLRSRLGDRALPGILEAHMLRELAARLTSIADGGTLLQLADSHLANARQAAALERDLPTLLRLHAGRDPADLDAPVWLAYGDPLWLVSARPRADRGDTTLLVVDAGWAAAEATTALGELVPVPVRLVSQDGGDAGELLGPRFPSLRAVFPPSPTPTNRHAVLRPGLLALVLALALFAAYLLWRDVQREIRTATQRSRFVSAVSHELKTPLTSIRMFAEMLRLHPEDTERHGAFLDTIIGESERLTRLIDNVLHFSRIDERRQRYHLQPGAIQQTVREAAESMRYPIAQDGRRLTVELDDAVPAVAHDRDALTHAILNLLTNAVKFSPSGGEIALALSRSNGDALISVRDHGVGIAPDEQRRIFEEFYRAADAQARGIEGTGLGLSLVADVARAHGGSVDVRSAPGAGSTFTLRIPLEA